MKHNIFIFISFLIFASCQEQQARKPKQHSTTSFYKELVAKNKSLNAKEKSFLKALIAKDTLSEYLMSSSGFWYVYEKKDSLNNPKPKPEELVTIAYNVMDINGGVIYPEVKRDYKVDKQDLIPALQDGIKLMKKGETITFVIPSYRAFGVTGDENKIGINQPIKSKLTLIEIHKNKNNENK